jgi:hypothetical protein
METPTAIAPLIALVPELKKVVLNVQFEEFAMKRLRHLIALAKALGDLYRKLRKTTRLKIWK